jgi:hypothetical protein
MFKTLVRDFVLLVMSVGLFSLVAVSVAGEFYSARISPVPANRLTVVIVIIVLVGQMVFTNARLGAALSLPARTYPCNLCRRMNWFAFAIVVLVMVMVIVMFVVSVIVALMVIAIVIRVTAITFCEIIAEFLIADVLVVLNNMVMFIDFVLVKIVVVIVEVGLVG